MTRRARHADGRRVRPPAVAGTFYPADPDRLADDVDAFLAALWRKAGLAPGAWHRGTRCSRYTAEKVVDPGPRLPCNPWVAPSAMILR